MCACLLAVNENVYVNISYTVDIVHLFGTFFRLLTLNLLFLFVLTRICLK